MSRFGLSERTAIEAGLYRKASFAQIAKQIGTTAKSVSEEIRRNRLYRFKTSFICRPYVLRWLASFVLSLRLRKRL